MKETIAGGPAPRTRRGAAGLLASAALLPLAGCAAFKAAVSTAAPAAAAGSLVAEVAGDAASLQSFYGIVKGIAQVSAKALAGTGLAADALVASAIEEGISKVDAIVAQGEAAFAAQASTVVSTAIQVLIQAAPYFDAVGSA